jgi:hypothetical protein
LSAGAALATYFARRSAAETDVTGQDTVATQPATVALSVTGGAALEDRAERDDAALRMRLRAEISIKPLPVRLATKPPLAPGHGRIFVETDVKDCIVLVDGTGRGPCPTPAIDLPAGWHDIACAIASEGGGSPLGAPVHIDAETVKSVGLHLRR